MCLASNYRAEREKVRHRGIGDESRARALWADQGLYTWVSQKKQKSEFWYATNPSGFHKLDEPPKKISSL